MKNCKQCSTQFEIADWDRQFYERMEVPEPTLCPGCRQRRRLIWANQINLYKRKCDATGEDIISAYHPDSSLKVYGQPHWWSDKWDATEYGRDYDFNRPFFEQWYELVKKVPRPALDTGIQFDENSEYTNFAGYNKNCYMLFDSDYNWDSYYSMGLSKSKNCVDNYSLNECELCYECVDCVKCYGLRYSQDCENCSDSAFLKNCINCKHCFMCSNLKTKEYFIFNQKYDKATYEKLINNLSKHSELQRYFKDWDAFKLKYPQKYMHGIQNEDVIGDYVVYSKNSENCFDSIGLWDCKYHTRAFGPSKDCMDCDVCGDNIELFYDSVSCGYNMQQVRFSLFCFSESHDLDYCFYCNFCHHCFGSIGLIRKRYCILNKEYSQGEYEELMPRIIEHMKSNNEWGEFFPAKYADFAYNETMANEYYPLTRDEALKNGYHWRNPDKKEYLPATMQVPDDSKEADQSICEALLACEDCGRNYKIVEQELKFYKKQGVPIPKKCFYCRHANRFAMRNPRILYDRKCDKCQADIKTTYSPEKPEKVYCESCYLKTVY